eukprot:CAMPEP_0116841438 /NCGR_PEP_ID=MMETSP0418-20121206/10923_1 /TAXON_ID=1158023 /ORGANISM="Astrosyne radiata, Strain 13vi08-1A" /LENGTH=106 /DNA_ID=CAMNT_0004471861 /DNA_START=1 /DNA_END=318 /DNA_ORIENTATION=-
MPPWTNWRVLGWYGSSHSMVQPGFKSGEISKAQEQTNGLVIRWICQAMDESSSAEALELVFQMRLQEYTLWKVLAGEGATRDHGRDAPIFVSEHIDDTSFFIYIIA